MLRPLTEADVEFEIECVPEDLPIQGNASAIDDETDAQLERDLREQLERGNEWAWCLVRVTARWAEYEGYDYLGGCSYASKEQFMHPKGYYPDMKARALADLNDVIATHARNLEPLLV
jgi:hypothetical protein